MTAFPQVDPTVPASRLKALMTSVALSKPGTWFYTNVASRLDPWIVRLTRGRLDSAVGVVPIVLMTARGARSGVERTVPLVYFSDAGDPILMASSFGRPRNPAWYYNAKASGRVTLYRRGRSGQFEVVEVEGEERDRLYALAAKLYRGYGIYEERVGGGRQIPVLRLSEIGSQPGP